MMTDSRQYNNTVFDRVLNDAMTTRQMNNGIYSQLFFNLIRTNQSVIDRCFDLITTR